MVLIKARRPKTSRKLIEKDGFTPWTSIKRLQNIQSLLKNESCDVLILILGMDGNFNAGSTLVVKYLLFDAFEKRKGDIEKTKVDDSTFDDLVLFIFPDRVAVYCNEVNYWLFLPFIASWPKIEIYCLPENLLDDSDSAETYKIETFLKLVEGCNCVGICHYDDRKVSSEFDPMVVEKWPLIQAHAFDDFGKKGRGFFTMKYNVVDLYSKLSFIFKAMDSARIYYFNQQVLPYFGNVYSNVLDVMNHVYGHKTEWVQQRLMEPIQSYFRHGSLSLDEQNHGSREPYLAFGEQTKKTLLHRLQIAGSLNLLESVDSSSTRLDKAPTHGVLQHVSPKDGITSVRTVFIGSTRSDSHVNRVLARCYRYLLQAFDTFLTSFCSSQNEKEAEEVAMKLLKKKMQRYEYASCAVKMEYLYEGAKDNLVYPRLITVAVYDICDNKGVCLGSLVYADTVVFSCLLEDNQTDVAVLYLTENIPRWTIVSDGLPSKLGKSFAGGDNDSAGSDIIEKEKCELLLTWTNCYPRVNALPVVATFVNDKVLITGQSVGENSILLERVQYFTESSEAPVVVVLLLQESQTSETTEAFLTDNRVFLYFPSKTPGRRAFFNNITSLWRRVQLPIEELSLNKMLNDSDLRAVFLHSRGSFGEVLEHLECSNCWLNQEPINEITWKFVGGNSARQYILSPTVTELLEEEKDLSVVDEKIIITVVCGHPGSYKEELSQCLLDRVHEDIQWVYVDVSSSLKENKGKFTWQNLIDPLSAALSTYSNSGSASRRNQQQSKKKHKTRRALVCMGHGHSAKLLQWALVQSDLDKHYRIGSVITCIDSRAAFIDGQKLTDPTLLELIRDGWVNNIVFTDPRSVAESEPLENMKTLLMAVNPSVSTIQISMGEVLHTNEIETLLSTTDFDNPKLCRSRFLSIPLLPVESELNSNQIWNEIYLPLKGCLDETKFAKSLRDLRNYKKKDQNEGIYFVEGNVCFNHENSQERSQFWANSVSGVVRHKRINNSLKIPQPPSALSSAGVNNQTTTTTSWIRIFAIKQNSESTIVNNDDNSFIKVAKNWVMKCAWTPPDPKPLRDINSLTLKEKELIKKQCKSQPLAEGWFYNGATYVHMDGRRSDTHPEYDAVCEEYLQQENKKIRENNREILKIKEMPLFD